MFPDRYDLHIHLYNWQIQQSFRDGGFLKKYNTP